MKKLILSALCIVCLLSQSCQTEESTLTTSQKQEIIDSAKQVVSKVFEYSNNLNFESGLNHYSDNENAYYITDGTMQSLDDVKKAYSAIGPSVEGLHNTIESWNAHVLSKDVVTFTLPVHLKLKLKGIPEFEGQLVWTATLQKQNDRWVIVQSHESWLNCAEVAAALTPTTNKE